MAEKIHALGELQEPPRCGRHHEIDGPSAAKMALAPSPPKSGHMTAVAVDDKSVYCNEGTGAHRVTASGPNGFGAIRETLSVL